MLPTTSGLETEWDYSGRKGRDGQKKKIGKANKRKGKVKKAKYDEVNGQGKKRRVPRPHTGHPSMGKNMEAMTEFKAQMSVAVVLHHNNKPVVS